MIDAIFRTIGFAYLLFTSVGGSVFTIMEFYGLAFGDEINLGRLIFGMVLLFLFFVGLKLFRNDK